MVFDTICAVWDIFDAWDGVVVFEDAVFNVVVQNTHCDGIAAVRVLCTIGDASADGAISS